MPKVYENVYGTSREKGNFLASEVGKKLETRDFTEYASTLGTDVVDYNGKTVKVIKKGKVYPSNGNGALGIVFEDVYPDANGNYIGSLMTGGYVWEERLEDTIASAATTSLKALGLYVVKHPIVSRPKFGSNKLTKLAKPATLTATTSAGISFGSVSGATAYIVFVNDEVVSNTNQTTVGVTLKVGDVVDVIACGDYKATSNSDKVTTKVTA